MDDVPSRRTNSSFRVGFFSSLKRSTDSVCKYLLTLVGSIGSCCNLCDIERKTKESTRPTRVCQFISSTLKGGGKVRTSPSETDGVNTLNSCEEPKKERTMENKRVHAKKRGSKMGRYLDLVIKVAQFLAQFGVARFALVV